MADSDALVPPVAVNVVSPVQNDGRPVLVARTAVVSPAVREACELYNATSARPMRRRWGERPNVFHKLLVAAYRAVGDTIALSPYGTPEPFAELSHAPPARNWVWVAFTAGKDSVAAALRMRDEGFYPILYHVHGLNRAWPNEVKHCRIAAVALGMPLVVDEVSVRGRKGDGAEQIVCTPLRNQILLLMMAARMAAHGGRDYVFGTVAGDTERTQSPRHDWSDAGDMMALGHDYAAARFPGLTCRNFLRDEVESLAIVAAHGMLDITHSCMTPDRFQGLRRRAASAQFGELLPGRCGACFKCCAEAVVLDAMGVRPASAKFLDHAHAVMRKWMTVTGRAAVAYIEATKDEIRAEADEHFRPAGGWPDAPVSPPARVPPPPLRPGHTLGAVYAHASNDG